MSSIRQQQQQQQPHENKSKKIDIAVEKGEKFYIIKTRFKLDLCIIIKIIVSRMNNSEYIYIIYNTNYTKYINLKD
jgi:hypothetical protein